jgi:predicted NAD/FAD-binding protein
MNRTRVAVVGAGISGLAAAWLLRARHEVTLYEAEDRLGGHAHTVDIDCDGIRHPVDTGFLVFNDRTYPHLVGLFRHLDVPVAASDMSFSVQVEAERLEWAGTSLATLFAQKRNLVNRKFWRMLGDILRFNRDAPRQLARRTLGERTVGEFLERGRYSAAFADWYLLPMAAAIWSCPVAAMREFPVASFVRFFDNHGLLGIANRPRWMTVRGGAREYVRRMAADLPDVRLACPVARITRDAHGVSVASACGVERYDQVVLAAHSDQALAMLGDAGDAERQVLGAVRYQPNEAILHTDASFLPRRREAWAAWNYVSACRPAWLSPADRR